MHTLTLRVLCHETMWSPSWLSSQIQKTFSLPSCLSVLQILPVRAICKMYWQQWWAFRHEASTSDEAGREEIIQQFAFRPFLSNLCAWLFYIAFGIIRPDGLFRKLWDVFTSLLLLYISIRLPYHLAFSQFNFSFHANCPSMYEGYPTTARPPFVAKRGVAYILDLLVDIFFGLDIWCARNSNKLWLVLPENSSVHYYWYSYTFWSFIKIAAFDRRHQSHSLVFS